MSNFQPVSSDRPRLPKPRALVRFRAGRSRKSHRKFPQRGRSSRGEGAETQLTAAGRIYGRAHGL
jgi:hypothetical protein